MKPAIIGAVAMSTFAGPVVADAVFAGRTIPARTVIAAADIYSRDVDLPGVFQDPERIIGLEARVALYPNRPIRKGDVGPPAVVERNAIISLSFSAGGLHIVTEGRAMSRAGVGDMVRVMNLSSRSTVFGVVQPDGSVIVQP